jgi:hypothetical protein
MYKSPLKHQTSDVWNNLTANNDSFGVYTGINSYSAICKLCVNHITKTKAEIQNNSKNLKQVTLSVLQ